MALVAPIGGLGAFKSIERLMKIRVDLESIYAPSDEIVAREIEGELIIVPLTSGVGNMEDELYALNETGRAIWAALDGKRTLKDVAKALSSKFKAPAGEIEKDALGLVRELLKRRMVVEVPQP